MHLDGVEAVLERKLAQMNTFGCAEPSSLGIQLRFRNVHSNFMVVAEHCHIIWMDQ